MYNTPKEKLSKSKNIRITHVFIKYFCDLTVISTYREPLRGWIDNLYGPTGVAAGAGTGLLRSIHCDGSVNANVVPADMTVNALIACAWDVVNIRRYLSQYLLISLFLYHRDAYVVNNIAD